MWDWQSVTGNLLWSMFEYEQNTAGRRAEWCASTLVCLIVHTKAGIVDSLLDVIG